MTLQPAGSAPYTTATAATTVLDAWRERGFGLPVTSDTLTRVGVQESLARRTFQSLVLLDLLNDDGTPTQQFEDFRATRGDDEYRTRVQEWLRGVYADVLQYADPGIDPQDRVTEAFRTYEPSGQRRSMATLLVGLWKYAGLPVKSDGSGDGRSRRVVVARPPARPKVTSTGQRGAKSSLAGNTGNISGGDFGGEALPPGLVGLLKQIPSNGVTWTTRRRDAFLQAFGAVLDFSVPVDDNPPVAGTEADREDDS